jgi:hypothetical protein
MARSGHAGAQKPFQIEVLADKIDDTVIGCCISLATHDPDEIAKLAANQFGLP